MSLQFFSSNISWSEHNAIQNLQVSTVFRLRVAKEKFSSSGLRNGKVNFYSQRAWWESIDFFSILLNPISKGPHGQNSKGEKKLSFLQVELHLHVGWENVCWGFSAVFILLLLSSIEAVQSQKRTISKEMDEKWNPVDWKVSMRLQTGYRLGKQQFCLLILGWSPVVVIELILVSIPKTLRMS